MSLATYADLETAVAAWLARSGDSVVTGSVADYITLCEARLAYGSGEPEDPDQSFYTAPLRIRAMETTAVIPINAVTGVSTVGGTANAITLTPSSAIASYAAGQTWNFTALSTIAAGGVTVNISGLGNRSVLKGSALSALAAKDIVAGQTVQLYDDGSELVYMPGTSNAPLPSNYLALRAAPYLDLNPRINLDYESGTQLSVSFNSQWPSTPAFFSIDGDTIRLTPPPYTAYNLVLQYYMKFGALSSATNWLMTNAPNVYLFGSLLEASIMLQMTDEFTQRYLRLFRSACNGIQTQDARDRHSGGSLTVRNDTGNP